MFSRQLWLYAVNGIWHNNCKIWWNGSSKSDTDNVSMWQIHIHHMIIGCVYMTTVDRSSNPLKTLLSQINILHISPVHRFPVPEVRTITQFLCPIFHIFILQCCHYSDVTISVMASEITSLTIVYSTIYSGVDQRKYQSPASLAFVRGIHR